MTVSRRMLSLKDLAVSDKLTSSERSAIKWAITTIETSVNPWFKRGKRKPEKTSLLTSETRS